MSELKGQLLGLVLVLSLFGIITVAMTTAFERSAETVQERVENAAYHGTSKPSRAERGYSLRY